MSAYNNMDLAIAGLKADNNSVTRIESRSAKVQIEFGETCWGYQGDPNKVYGYVLDAAKIVWDADFVTSNSIQIIVDGDSWDPVVYATSHDNTMDLLIAEGQAQGYEVALDATDTDNRTLYIKKSTAGTAVGTVSGTVTLGASQAGDTVTYQSDQVFLGVAQFPQKYTTSANGAAYYINDSVSVMSIGIIWAISTGTNNSEDDAFITLSGANAGVFAAGSAGDVNAIYRGNNYTNPTTSDVIAKVEVKGPVKLNTEIAWV